MTAVRARDRRRIMACGALVAGVALSCHPPTPRYPPPTTYPADARYPERCPPMDIHPGEYATLTIVAAPHVEPAQLVADCDERTLSGCHVEFCAPLQRTPNSLCVAPDHSDRRLLEGPAAPGRPAAGRQIVAEPFCFGGKCELALAFWPVGADGGILRRDDCRLLASEIRFESAPGKPDLIAQCTIQRDDGTGQRDCYPIY